MRNKTSAFHSDSECSCSSRPSFIFTPLAAPCIIERLANNVACSLRYFLPKKIFSCFIFVRGRWSSLWSSRLASGSFGFQLGRVPSLESLPWSRRRMAKYSDTIGGVFCRDQNFFVTIQCGCEEVDSRGNSDQA